VLCGDDAPLAIVDIDGVVADVRHRLHHIEGFFDAAGDEGLQVVGGAVVERLRKDHEVVYLTGRPRWLHAVTDAWLAEHGLGGHRLVMRPDDDRRPAVQLKVEVLCRLAIDRKIGIVVDDDARVIRAMAEAGFPTFHADWEQRALDEQRALSQAQEEEGRT